MQANAGQLASRSRPRFADRFLASDPGLVRLTLASRAACSLAAVLAVSDLVATATGLPTLVMLVLGAVLTMMTTFTVADPTLRGRLATQLCLPVVMLVGLGLATLVDHNRVVSLCLFVVVMFVVVWVRRFGPRFFACGMVAWIGYFIALFLTLPASALLSAVAAVGVAAGALLVIAFLAPHRPARRLRRMLDSFAARVRIARAEPTDLDRALLRVNEVAVLVDGQLAIPGAVPDAAAAARVRDAVLSVELAVTVELERRRESSPGSSGAVDGAGPVDDGGSGTRPGDGEVDRALAHLAAVAADPSVPVASAAPGVPAPGAVDRPHVPGVELFAGFLPGSVVTVGTMVEDAGPLAFATRQALQVAMAGGLAIVLGDLVSGQRWYWAVLACFLAFTGTATAAEAVTKAAQRTIGTVVGVALALVVVPLIGSAVPVVILVVLLAIFVGFYLFRVSYTCLAIAITIVVGELYELLGSFSGGLLALRIGETALGAVIGAVVAIAFLPASAQRAESTARESLTENLRAVLVDVVDVLAHPGRAHSAEVDLAQRIRALDAGLHQLSLVGVPLTRRTSTTASGDRADLRRHLDDWVRCAARVRALVRSVERHDPRTVLDARVHDAATAVGDLAEALTTGDVPAHLHRTPTPSGSEASDVLLRELASLHGALLAIHEIAAIEDVSGAASPVSDGVGSAFSPGGVVAGDGAGGVASPASDGVRVHGRVVAAEDGASAVPDAVVTLVDADGHQRGRTRVRDGHYVLALPGPGTWQIVAAAPDRAPRADRLAVGPRTREVVHDLVLASPRALAPR